ncbi:MAG: hypothetical protein Q4A75_06290 [Peptostreptococcaceae bacterium]|nr:hypothetical protein [Peptostreptococcaceae bacterium]
MKEPLRSEIFIQDMTKPMLHRHILCEIRVLRQLLFFFPLCPIILLKEQFFAE